MVWYGMVWYDMVWYDMVWYGMVVALRNTDTLNSANVAQFIGSQVHRFTGSQVYRMVWYDEVYSWVWHGRGSQVGVVL